MQFIIRRMSLYAPAIVSLLTSACLVRAQLPPDVPYPDAFRSWQHVKSIVIGPQHRTFATRGGIHHYYANNLAVEGYRTGTFANGSVIVDEGVITKAGEGPAEGITLEGDRRALDVMIKNDRLYQDTGGWGFEHFEGTTTTPTLTASARATCLECHSKASRDHVFSAIRE